MTIANSGDPLDAGVINWCQGLYTFTKTLTFSASTSHIETGLPYGVTLPNIPVNGWANISSGSSTTIGWTWRLDSFGLTTCRLLLAGASQAWAGIPVIITLVFDPS